MGLMTNSFSSSQNIWTPDGRCPSFADILKRSTGSEEAINENRSDESILQSNEKHDTLIHNVTTTAHIEQDLTNCKDRNELSSRLSSSFAVSSITFEQPTSQQSFIIQDPKQSMTNTENSNSLSLFSDSVIFPSDDTVVHTSSISKITQLEKDCKGIRMQNT